MSVVESEIDVDGLVPDGIEAVEAFRCWGFDGTHLVSLNGEPWTTGAPLEAACVHGSGKTWAFKRGGWSLDEARQYATYENSTRSMSMYSSRPPLRHLRHPLVEPPDGYGYVPVTITHDAPHVDCTCGIYAATTEHGVPGGGVVYGKVKLWGKIVPGERGVRAQYAYPSEFRVPAHLVDDPVLKSFAVPVVLDDTPRDPGADVSYTLSPTSGASLAYGIETTTDGPRFPKLLAIALIFNIASLGFAIGYYLW